MRIKIISDIHLEFLKKIKPTWINHMIKPNADVLALAGDIGYPFLKEYENFLIETNKIFNKIFIITGNHEYYSDKSIEENDNQIKKIIADNKLTNMTFLSNSYEDYNGFRFVGSTMWTHISDPKFLINDFKCIKDMTVEKYNDLHKEAVYFVENTIRQSELPIVMITHHLPSFTLNDPKYASYSGFNQCFSANLDHLISNPVKLWIYGHTHTPSDKEINGVKLVCNPIGYPQENYPVDFNKIVEI